MRVPSLTRAWPLPLSSFCASLFRDATLKNRRITRSICLKYGAEKCNGLTAQNHIVGEDGERKGVGERKWNRSSFATIGLQSDRNEIFKKNLNSNLLQLCISQHYAHTHMHSYVCTYRVRNVIHRQHSSRIHTHTHTHRVTNAPTYTNTHTDTFVAVTRATTFEGFFWIMCVVHKSIWISLECPISVPSWWFLFSFSALLFHFTMDAAAAATFVCSFHTHSLNRTHTHTDTFEMIPFPSGKKSAIINALAEIFNCSYVCIACNYGNYLNTDCTVIYVY